MATISEVEVSNHESIASESPPIIIHQPLEGSMVPQQDLMEELALSQSSRQNSIMSLTLEEFQTKSGKSFGSMNMDEFLNNIWSSNVIDGDDNLCVQPNLDNNNNNEPMFDQNLGNQSGLPRQSSFCIPSPISEKTVDEVWFEIQRDRPQQQNLHSISVRESLHRQQTFGEMTLEDFLVKAGIVQCRTIKPSDNTITNNNIDVGNYPNGNLCFSDHNAMVDRVSSFHYLNGHNIGHSLSHIGIRPYQMGTENDTLKGESSYYYGNEDERGALSRSNGRKRKEGSLDSQTEETIDRRNRRMLKNRESAARSRSRKQAYTVELELELNQLKQSNEKLKKIMMHHAMQQLMMKKLETMEDKRITEETAAPSICRSMSMQW